MNRLASAIIGAVLLLAGAAYVNAQLVPAPGPPTAIACAYNSSPPTVASGNAVWVQCTEEGKLDVNASVSASISGFEPATTGTPVVADTDGETETLPAGDVVVAFNTSTSITAYCMLGAAATVADVAIPPSSWFAFTVGAATQLTCITASSTATVNTVGGAGLPTGAGGGGGGGGAGGAITAPLGTATAAADSVAVVIQGGSALNANGQASMANSAPVVIASNQTAVPVQLSAQTTGGCTPATVSSAASTNATVAKAAAGTLCKSIVENTTTTIYYLLMYDKATAPTCNSDTILARYAIPPASAAGQVGGIVSGVGPYGEAYTSGISFCITANADGTGNAATGVYFSYSFK